MFQQRFKKVINEYAWDDFLRLEPLHGEYARKMVIMVDDDGFEYDLGLKKGELGPLKPESSPEYTT